MSADRPLATATSLARRRGMPLSVRVALGAAIIIVLSNTASIVVQYYGFPPLRYPGRTETFKKQMAQGMSASAEAMRVRMSEWFSDRAQEAQMLARAASASPWIDTLASASPAGWPSAAREQALHMGASLVALIQNNGAIAGLRIVDRVSGNILADSFARPFGERMDASWISPTSTVRVDADGRCALASPFRSPRGASLALLLYLRLDRLFEQIRSDRLDKLLGLDLAILDAEQRVLNTSNRAEFPPGRLVLPQDSMRLLASGVVREVPASDGERLLAGVFTVPDMQQTGFTLFVASRMATIQATMKADRSAAAGAAAIATLAGLFLVWITMSRLFKPLTNLEATITAFALGIPGPPMPKHASGRIGFIADALGNMMDQVTDWRRELEAEVAERTAELRSRSEVATLFANQEDDSSAYLDLVALITRAMHASEGMLAWLEEGSGLVYGFPSRSVRSIEAAELSLLRAAADDSQGPMTMFGREWAQHVSRRLEITPTVQALVILFSDDPFAKEHVESIDRLFVELVPLMRARSERRMQEAIRLEAERSLRRSEERLRTFFEDSHDMIYTANAEDVIASMNSAGLALLGFKDRFSVVGRLFSNFALNKEDRQHFLQKIREHGFASDYEIVLKRANGQTVFCLETAQAVKDREGRILEIQGIIKDISERINSERELWHTNMELAEANARLKETQMVMVQNEKLASIGQLAAGIAHEINNPLGFLKSNHGVLARFYDTVKKAWVEGSSLDPELTRRIAQKYDLDYVFEEIESVFGESDDGYRRIMDIVSNLKSFARTESETKITAYELNRGIESTLTVARNEIKYVAEVELRLGELPPIEAAGGEVNQVLLNILVNAAQAIAGQKREAMGHILVETGRVEDRVYCVISDDGPGIPVDLRMRIFDPFFTTKEPGKGTGLGLSISYDIIVNKHGGKLIVDASPEGGARFRLELPIKHIEAEAAERTLV